MPRGTYRHLGDGSEEHFQCAPGPGGWRYVSQRPDGGKVDLTVDSRWRQIRVELLAAGWRLRGGVTGREVIWVRSAAEAEPSASEAEAHEYVSDAAGFLSDSPAFLIAVARSLRLEPGGHAEVPLVHLSAPALAAVTVAQRWACAGVTSYETELEPLPVESYEITDLSTGDRHVVQIAGDVVVEAPDVELIALESPPNLDRRG